MNRYIAYCNHEYPTFTEAKNGKWVKYEDVKKLIEENDDLKKTISQVIEMYNIPL